MQALLKMVFTCNFRIYNDPKQLIMSVSLSDDIRDLSQTGSKRGVYWYLVSVPVLLVNLYGHLTIT